MKTRQITTVSVEMTEEEYRTMLDGLQSLARSGSAIAAGMLSGSSHHVVTPVSANATSVANGEDQLPPKTPTAAQIAAAQSMAMWGHAPAAVPMEEGAEDNAEFAPAKKRRGRPPKNG